MTLGIRLLTARERAGLTQEQVAKAANMRARYYSSIEDDEIERPTPITLQKLADALSVPLEYLLGQEQELAETIEEVVSPAYAAFIRWVMGLVIALGVLCLAALFMAFLTFLVVVLSDKLSGRASLDAVPEPKPILASNQEYTEILTPSHLPPQICHLENK